MSDVKNVTASKPGGGTSGAVRWADYGTALPSDAVAALAEAFKTTGYISEDGFSQNIGFDTNNVNDWGGNNIFNGQTSSTKVFKIKFMEALNPNVLAIIYEQENVVGNSIEDGLSVFGNDYEHKPKTWVIDEILKDDTLARTVIPNGTITSISEIKHAGNEVLGYEVEITASPDAKLTHTINGKTVPCSFATYYKKNAAA